jgi:putative hemolysin
MPIDQFADEMGFALDGKPDYETVAGFVIDEIKRLPKLGETFTAKGWHFEVVDMDGRRVDKLLVRKSADNAN